jgi:hypothetical protein
MTRDQWVSAFVTALTSEDLRPDVGLKFAHVVAQRQWVAHQNLDPEEAANQWALASAKHTTKPVKPINHG